MRQAKVGLEGSPHTADPREVCSEVERGDELPKQLHHCQQMGIQEVPTRERGQILPLLRGEMDVSLFGNRGQKHFPRG